MNLETMRPEYLRNRRKAGRILNSEANNSRTVFTPDSFSWVPAFLRDVFL
jgi:hypothetical protein